MVNRLFKLMSIPLTPEKMVQDELDKYAREIRQGIRDILVIDQDHPKRPLNGHTVTELANAIIEVKTAVEELQSLIQGMTTGPMKDSIIMTYLEQSFDSPLLLGGLRNLNVGTPILEEENEIRIESLFVDSNHWTEVRGELRPKLVSLTIMAAPFTLLLGYGFLSAKILKIKESMIQISRAATLTARFLETPTVRLIMSELADKMLASAQRSGGYRVLPPSEPLRGDPSRSRSNSLPGVYGSSPPKAYS